MTTYHATIDRNQLAQILTRTGWPQRFLAEKLSTSQKTISNILAGKNAISAPMEAKIRRLIETENLASLLEGEDTPIQSSRYSYSQHTFDTLWDDARKRVDTLTVRSILRLQSDRIDNRFELQFDGLSVTPGDFIYLDHTGFPEQASTTGPTLVEGAGLCMMDHDAIRQSKQNSMAYTLLPTIAEQERLRIRLDWLGCHQRGQADVAGCPIYSDLTVRRLIFEIGLVDLVMEPEIPTPLAYLLRRVEHQHWFEGKEAEMGRATKIAAESSPMATWEGKPITWIRWGPLMRPRPGYGYCLSWKSLQAKST